MSKMLALPDKVLALTSEAEKRTGLPKGAVASLIIQEVGGQLDKFLKQPDAFHYAPGPNGKKPTSSARGLIGVLRDTATKPGYGVTPLKDYSIEEQIRFGADYLAARVKQAGSFEKGLAGYGEGAKYAQEVKDRMEGKSVRGRPSPQQLQQVQVQPPQQVVAAAAARPQVEAPMQVFESQTEKAPTMSYQDQVAQEMEAFLKMGQPKSEVEALMMAQAQQEAEAQQAMQARAQVQVPAQEDSFMNAFNYVTPQGNTPLQGFGGFTPYSAFNAWGRG